MKRFKHARLAGLIALVLANASPPSIAHAQVAQSVTTSSPRSVTGVRFKFSADGPIRGGFALAGKNLLFGTDSGTVYAIDAQTGRLTWRRPLGSAIASTPAVANDRAYVTSWDNVLHAMDVRTGKDLWTRSLGKTRGEGDYWEFYSSSPIATGGMLFVGSADGQLYAFDANSGRLLWASDCGARIRSSPAVSERVVVIGTMAGHVIAFDRRDGRRLWTFATEGAAHEFALKDNDTRSVVTPPIIRGTTVVAGGRDGNLYGIDLSTGRGLWKETHDGGSWILGLASDSANVYSGSGSAFIMQSADLLTGKERWRTPTANAMFGGVVKAGDVLISNGLNGMIAGFDDATGAMLWRFALPDTAFSSPLAEATLVYTGVDDGSVYALETSTQMPAPSERSIFSYTDEPPASAFWFKPESKSSILGGFRAAGFADLGNVGLGEALATPMTAKGRRIIVLADSRLPDQIDAARLRSFLDGGGGLILLGINPVIYDFGADGAPSAVDDERSKIAFGIDPADKERDSGYNVSRFTPDGEKLGLSGTFVATGWVRPEQVTKVLARDRSGNATAWIKQFPKGGFVVQLPVPRTRSFDISRYVNAVVLAAQ